MKKIALSVRDHIVIKAVQATHPQGEIRYGTSRSIQYSSMPIISVSWALFRSPGKSDKLDLLDIWGKEDYLFISVDKIRYFKTYHKSSW